MWPVFPGRPDRIQAIAVGRRGWRSALRRGCCAGAAHDRNGGWFGRRAQNRRNGIGRGVRLDRTLLAVTDLLSLAFRLGLRLARAVGGDFQTQDVEGGGDRVGIAAHRPGRAPLVSDINRVQGLAYPTGANRRFGRARIGRGRLGTRRSQVLLAGTHRGRTRGRSRLGSRRSRIRRFQVRLEWGRRSAGTARRQSAGTAAVCGRLGAGRGWNGTILRQGVDPR